MISQSVPHYPTLTLVFIGVTAFFIISLIVLLAYRQYLSNDEGSNDVIECDVTCDILSESIHANAFRINEEEFMKNVDAMLSSRPYYLTIKNYKGNKLAANPFHYNGKLVWLQPDGRVFESNDGANWTVKTDLLPASIVNSSTVVGVVAGVKSINGRKAIFRLELFPGPITKLIIKKLAVRSFRLIVEPAFMRDAVLGMNSSIRDTVVGVHKFYLIDRTIQKD